VNNKERKQMDKLNKRIGAVGAVFFIGGLLLMFGAVGGMDDPSKEAYFIEQAAAAVIGGFWMLVGARLLQD
jgi:hypothetical protein